MLLTITPVSFVPNIKHNINILPPISPSICAITMLLIMLVLSIVPASIFPSVESLPMHVIIQPFTIVLAILRYVWLPLVHQPTHTFQHQKCGSRPIDPSNNYHQAINICLNHPSSLPYRILRSVIHQPMFLHHIHPRDHSSNSHRTWPHWHEGTLHIH